MFKLSKNKGFALLYAILLSGAVLVVGVILMNIITKQLIFSSLSRNSETSYYYVANSGRECLMKHINLDSFVDFDPFAPTGSQYSSIGTEISFSCFGTNFSLVETSFASDIYEYKTATPVKVKINGNDYYLGLSVKINLGKLNGSPVPVGDAIDKFNYLAVADGYNQDPSLSGERLTKRSTVYAK